MIEHFVITFINIFRMFRFFEKWETKDAIYSYKYTKWIV